MPKLVAFTLCDQIGESVLPNGTAVPVLVGPTIRLRPPFIPTLYSFGVYFGLRDLGDKPALQLAINVYDPEGQRIFTTGKQAFKIELPSDAKVPSEYHVLMCTIQLPNVTFAVEGIYKITIGVDGEEMDACSIPVYAEAD